MLKGYENISKQMKICLSGYENMFEGVKICLSKSEYVQGTCKYVQGR